MADIYDVIADPTRRQLMGVLLDRYLSPLSETGEISVGDLVEQLALSQPTVSKHLKVLRDHGLVSVREDGQHRFYRLDSAPLEEIEDFLVPYLSADFDPNEVDDAEDLIDTAALQGEESAVFAAWSGADVGDTIGRKVAEGTHQARTVLQDAQDRVTRRLPKRFRRES